MCKGIYAETAGAAALASNLLDPEQPLCWLLVISIQKIGISAKNITKEQPSRTGSRSHLPKREHLSSSGPSCFAASSARKAKL